MWNRDVFGRVEVHRDVVAKELEDWDLEAKESGLSHIIMDARNDATKKLWELDQMLEIHWRQNSRAI